MRIEKKPGHTIVTIDNQELGLFPFLFVAPFAWLDLLNDFQYSMALDESLGFLGLFGDLIVLALAAVGLGGLIVPIIVVAVSGWSLLSSRSKRDLND